MGVKYFIEPSGAHVKNGVPYVRVDFVDEDNPTHPHGHFMPVPVDITEEDILQWAENQLGTVVAAWEKGVIPKPKDIAPRKELLKHPLSKTVSSKVLSRLQKCGEVRTVQRGVKWV